MAKVVAVGQKVLPRGWLDFGIQVLIWFGFYFSYLAFLYHGPLLLEQEGVPARFAALVFSSAAGCGMPR